MVATVLAATTGVLLVMHPWHRGVGAPRQPAVTFVQDATGVHVHIHNVNAHWGLRDQPFRVMLRAEGGFPIRTYGPHEDDGNPGQPPFWCCTIGTLPPHGDYSIDLFPVDVKVAGIDVTLRGGRYWIRM